MIFEPWAMAREKRLPKNNAAETGQKERAKTIPRNPAPHIPKILSEQVKLTGGASHKGAQYKKIYSLPGSPAMWAGSFTFYEYGCYFHKKGDNYISFSGNVRCSRVWVQLISLSAAAPVAPATATPTARHI